MDYCTLPADINHCQYYNPQAEGVCNGGPATCGYIKREEDKHKKSGFIREPRWYETYLR